MFSKVVIASAIVASASGSPSGHWAYANYCNAEDVRGVAPNQWNQLGNTACISSVAGDQTPIDIDCGVAKPNAAYENYFQVSNDATVSNNGHSIKVSFPTSPGNVTTNIVSLTSGGDASVMDAYKSAQIHVHWQKTSDNAGSEHSINGVFYPMEMHFVNYHSRFAGLGDAVGAGTSDALQVFGVMFEESTTEGNAELQLLIDAMDAAHPSGNGKGDSANLASTNPCNFIEGGCGDQADFSFYNGGLTTPPCNSASGSIVQWAMNSKISKISTAQLNWFKTKTFAGSADGVELISEYGNSRPIQPRGQRDIYVKGTAVTSNPSCSKANIGEPWTEATTETIPSCPETMSPTPSPTTPIAIGDGSGSDSANACPGACTGTGGDRVCKFTAKLDIFASDTGYYVFDECGATVQPVLAMEAGVKYIFDQADDSNWLHPLGFAYFPDGAHVGVDELEAGISQTTGNSCVDDNTCDAPMYYQGNTFLGSFHPDTGADESIVYPTSGNSGNFGLDTYEPRFKMGRGDWTGQSEKFTVTLTITDEEQTDDIFYFCHIHSKMSGRIKIIRNGVPSSPSDVPALYSHHTLTNFDIACGTFGLGGYTDGKVCAPMESGKFFCPADDETAEATNFNECLYAMDCAMHTEMRVNTHESDPLTTFMHQMIPHHQNAVNMAKAILKKVPGKANEGELGDLLWSIVNEQNMQIGQMENWLSEYERVTYAEAICEETVANVTTTSCAPDNVESPAAVVVDDDKECYNAGVLVWAIIVTVLLVLLVAFNIYEKNYKVHPTQVAKSGMSTTAV